MNILGKKYYLFILLMCALSLRLNSQTTKFEASDFRISGDAMSAGPNCFQLTESTYWQGGSVWYKKSLDLQESFEIELELTFGCDDEGADGIVFILHPILTNGYRGEGMGFGGLFPSFGIEMDTYENFHLGDPEYDHVAFMANGQLRHYWGLTEPVLLKSGVENVEDCDFHWVKIKWDPSTKNVEFYFDGSLRIREQIDLVKDVFEGYSEVYWGFTSATGAKYNRHKLCLENLVFTEPLTLGGMDKELLLKGERYILKNLNFAPGSTQLPKDAIPELKKLIDFFNQNPDHSISINGFTDSSGDATKNEELSRLRAKAIADFLTKNGIKKNRVFYFGRGESAPIDSNDTKEGRKRNRRVEITMRILKV